MGGLTLSEELMGDGVRGMLGVGGGKEMELACKIQKKIVLKISGQQILLCRSLEGFYTSNQAVLCNWHPLARHNNNKKEIKKE